MVRTLAAEAILWTVSPRKRAKILDELFGRHACPRRLSSALSTSRPAAATILPAEGIALPARSLQRQLRGGSRWPGTTGGLLFDVGLEITAEFEEMFGPPPAPHFQQELHRPLPFHVHRDQEIGSAHRPDIGESHAAGRNVPRQRQERPAARFQFHVERNGRNLD